MHQGLRDADAALEALRQGFDTPVPHFREIDPVDQEAETLARRRRIEAAHAGDEFEEGADSHVRIGGGAFRQIAEDASRRHRIGAAVVAIEKGFARIGLQEAGDDFHGCGFAGTIGTEKADDFAALHRKRHVVHRSERTKAFHETAGLDERHMISPLDWPVVGSDAGHPTAGHG